MIEKIQPNHIPDMLEKSSAQQSGPAKTTADNQEDASLQVDYDSLIEKAKQTASTDPNALQQARDLLLSGQLESPENIQEVAENIIKYGI